MFTQMKPQKHHNNPYGNQIHPVTLTQVYTATKSRKSIFLDLDGGFKRLKHMLVIGDHHPVSKRLNMNNLEHHPPDNNQMVIGSIPYW